MNPTKRAICVCTCVIVAGALVLVVEGCGGGGGTPAADPALPVMDHTLVVLKDELGLPIPVGSTVAYSPRQTCGTCHDVDAIANGYHFQQGRTDASGAVVMADDYFGDGRAWLKSSGMYGKW